MNKTILLVEDDMILSEMYQEKLALEGFIIVVAEDGETALKLAKKKPALILLDIMMPGMNGFEVLRILKNNPRTTAIPVIVLTNIGSETADNDKNLALSLGAKNYLVKSYHTPEDVIKIVKRTLKQQSPT